jgi:putative membrane protein
MTTMLHSAAQVAGHPFWRDRVGDDGSNWWVIFPIAWLLLVGAAVTFAVLAWRRRSGESGVRAGERVLAERFAAGEIDEDEYRGRLAVVRQSKS